MNKINFVNGQAPYINDTNLNQMQTNIENAINKDYIVVKPSQNQSVTSAVDTWTTINFDTVLNQSGTKFTLNNNKIIVGAGVSNVEVIAKIWTFGSGTYNWIETNRYRNGSAYQIGTSIGETGSAGWCTLNDYNIVPVQQGDEIVVKVLFQGGTGRMEGGTYGGSVILCVKEI